MTRKYTVCSLAILVLFFMNCASIPAQVANPPKPPAMDEAQVHFDAAATYYYAGRFEEAIREYQQGLSINPDDYLARTNLGLALLKLHKTEQGIRELKLALQLQPGQSGAHTNLSYGYLEAGRFVDALKSAGDALLLDSKNAAAYNNLGYAYLRLGRYDEGIEALKQCIELDPGHVKAYSNLGQVYLRMGRHTEAAEVLEKAVQMNPDELEPRMILGQVDFMLGRYQEAASELEQANRIDPTFYAAYFMRGDALRELRRFEEAVDAYSQGIKLRPQEAEPYSSRAYANLNLRRGEVAAADAQTYLTISRGQGSHLPYMHLVIYFGDRIAGRQAEATQAVEEFLASDKSSAWPVPVFRYLRGDILPHELLALADDGDKKTEANAYIGMQLSISGRHAEAMPYLQWVKENGNRKFVEYPLALSELEQLR